MTARLHALVGRLQVPQTIADAFVLFTPEGEREWAHGWDPHYPGEPVGADHGSADVDAARRDDTEPGTVFETDAHGSRTTWIVTRRDRPRYISYARVTAGGWAGTVSVALAPFGDVSEQGAVVTEVEVTYVLTALVQSAEGELQRFADGYVEYLRSWERDIAGLVARRGSSRA
ncbi:SRPBCC family protein [Planctomonas sp. JC2975]|uniref:SRPBCC family protein n=1 Tax=Planctomonas sp. JC2975 TaxID=2729626 RepID=UPI00147434D0|nr:SRPBCC family protein [Planctomonas sp. JC2975]NNC13817.1 SRPBCC family protein [Planctomonas sp. JC2975]